MKFNLMNSVIYCQISLSPNSSNQTSSATIKNELFRQKYHRNYSFIHLLARVCFGPSSDFLLYHYFFFLSCFFFQLKQN